MVSQDILSRLKRVWADPIERTFTPIQGYRTWLPARIDSPTAGAIYVDAGDWVLIDASGDRRAVPDTLFHQLFTCGKE